MRRILLLTSPVFGLAFSMTLFTAFLPILARESTKSQLLIGAIVSAEGMLALVLPTVVGSVSDKTRSRFGARLPFMAAAAPFAAGFLAALPFARSMALTACLALGFYVAYFTYYTPFRALFPDLLAPGDEGRANGVLALMRNFGLGAALVGGGALLEVWRPLPFLLAGAALLGITVLIVRKLPRVDGAGAMSVGSASAVNERVRLVDRIRAIASERPRVIRLLLSTVLWEFATAGLKTFVVGFIVIGMGMTTGAASLLLGAFVAIAAVAAPLAGVAADRIGAFTLMKVALWVYGLGLLIPFFTQSVGILLAALPLVGAGGAVVITLPFAMLAQAMPAGGHGTFSGLYELSRGIGTLGGPLVTGAAIDFLRPWLTSTNGYAAMWPALALAVLASLLVLPSDAGERPTRA